MRVIYKLSSFLRQVGLILSLIVGLIFFSQEAFATHIRAGEITAVRTGTFSYCFTITIYTDNDSSADSPSLDMNFGDGTTGIAERVNQYGIGNNTTVNVYSVCHTFPSSGAFFVSFTEENRNAGVLNMDNSVNTPFSVETLIVIDPAIGLNDTPILTVPPIDVACVGQRFTHNPGAFDSDGDSLAFKIFTPRQDRDQFVDGYLDPATVSIGGQNPLNEDETAPATFEIDPITGTLTWDAPAFAGEYNIAFLVEEWRNGIRIGYVVRDMQIIVEDCPNERPNLEINDVCVAAKAANNNDPSFTDHIVNETITATDPDDPLQDLIISSPDSQAVYSNSFFVNTATFTFNPNPQTSPATANFRWETACEHVRREPYIVVFKAEDRPPSPSRPLVDVQTMLITVVGPQPTGLTATPNGRQMDLTWDDYTPLCPDADSIVIWRRSACNNDDFCRIDEMTAAGYVAIATLPVTATSYTDPGPLSRGVSYSYRISAKYPEPEGGDSKPSQEACAYIPLIAPVITKVSVQTTDPSAGEIELRWIFPPELNGTAFPVPSPPYNYHIFRSADLNGTNFGTTPIAIVPAAVAPDPSQEEVFIDTNLDTENNAYNYKIELRTGPAQDLEEPSDSASSVRLSAVPGDSQITLTWDYVVPWSNQNQNHEIYRRTENTSFVKIDEVFVGVREYVDNGNPGCLSPDSTYYYYVTTVGSYGNPLISIDPLRNDSQVVPAVPSDNTPPPPPVLEIAPLDCSIFSNEPLSNPNDCGTPDVSPIQNVLTWEAQTNVDPCLNDIAEYRLYYKSTLTGEYTRLPDPPFAAPYTGTSFTHVNPSTEPLSQAGCYVVTAVDKSGNESQFSNEVCQDNCVYFDLPNIITPNGDGKNDVFRPMPNPRFVESVEFTVYNRWGNKVFSRDDCIQINWDGRNEGGNELPTGLYYYTAKVRFLRLNPEEAEEELKGWVQIVR